MSILLRDKADIVSAILTDQDYQIVEPKAKAFAPTNIALCKYWGKRDQALHLPCNSSVSFGLAEHGCTTEVSVIDGECDQVWLNGDEVDVCSRFYQRLSAYLNLFRGLSGHQYLVKTDSNIPIAAGLASSACGFAAVVLALRRLYGWSIDERACSILARLGSGSAARSIWPGFVAWQRGGQIDGMDSYAYPLLNDWPEFCMGVLLLNQQQKAVSSRQAMQNTVETSPLYTVWPDRAETDFVAIRQAIIDHDFITVASLAEANALFMHATMQSALPPVNYWQAESIAAMQKVWRLRRQGLPIYLTMDAGPNVKLLYRSQDKQELLRHFPSMLF